LAILSLHLAEWSQDRRVATRLTHLQTYYLRDYFVCPAKRRISGSSLEQILRYWIAINLLSFSSSLVPQLPKLPLRGASLHQLKLNLESTGAQILASCDIAFAFTNMN
jgi:hypothetical protein